MRPFQLGAAGSPESLAPRLYVPSTFTDDSSRTISAKYSLFTSTTIDRLPLSQTSCQSRPISSSNFTGGARWNLWHRCLRPARNQAEV